MTVPVRWLLLEAVPGVSLCRLCPRCTAWEWADGSFLHVYRSRDDAVMNAQLIFANFGLTTRKCVSVHPFLNNCKLFRLTQ